MPATCSLVNLDQIWVARHLARMHAPTSLYDAKTHLSALVDRAAAGEEIVIAKAGKPMARLVPLPAPAPRAKPVLGGGPAIVIADEFDAPLPDDLLAAFGGAPDRSAR